MDRRQFLQQTTAATIGSLVSVPLSAAPHPAKQTGNKQLNGIYPRAITMWDFSWLERRWDGAGFENWDLALDELTERGYNAIRIDAYPHLQAVNPTKKWMLNEVWNQQVWGSPDLNEVQIQPNLNKFLSKCGERDVKVGLSSWYRQDVDKTHLQLTTPAKMAECWLTTIRNIEKDGLLDTILYVDLCNEWPGNAWAAFFAEQYPQVQWGQWYKEESLQWMKQAIDILRKEYPDMPFNFSFDNQEVEKYEEVDTSFLDLYEHHIWMVQQNKGEFTALTGYDYGRFSPEGYKNLVKNGERLYREKPSYWQELLTDKIRKTADVARRCRRPLITTECWGVVDYKDWPLLHWDWVKELCALGATTAARTGMWVGVATSNFCSPQFVGMWRDVEWHKRLTSIIRTSPLDESITRNNPVAEKLLKRL